jgi:chaperonin GroES
VQAETRARAVVTANKLTEALASGRLGRSRNGTSSPSAARSHHRKGDRGGGEDQRGGKLIPVDVKRGDRVLFDKYAGTEIKIDGEDHLILREDDVLGIIEE